MKFEAAPLMQFWKDSLTKGDIKPLKNWDYHKYKTSDTCFILGSGPSVNELSNNEFEIISRHNSIGFNMWPVHWFVPTIYESEAESSGMLYRLFEEKKELYADVPYLVFDCMTDHTDLNRIPPVMRKNMFIAETHFILGDGKTKASYQKSLSEMFYAGFFAPKERIEIVCRRRSSGVFNLSLAIQMGYKNIILVGYDMLNHDYFHDYEQLKKPKEKYCSETTAEGIPASLVIEAMTEAVCKPMGITLSIGTKNSALYPFLPLYDWKREADGTN